jgi:hypothetical protein
MDAVGVECERAVLCFARPARTIHGPVCVGATVWRYQQQQHQQEQRCQKQQERAQWASAMHPRPSDARLRARSAPLAPLHSAPLPNPHAPPPPPISCHGAVGSLRRPSQSTRRFPVGSPPPAAATSSSNGTAQSLCRGRPRSRGCWRCSTSCHCGRPARESSDTSPPARLASRNSTGHGQLSLYAARCPSSDSRTPVCLPISHSPIWPAEDAPLLASADAPRWKPIAVAADHPALRALGGGRPPGREPVA